MLTFSVGFKTFILNKPLFGLGWIVKLLMVVLSFKLVPVMFVHELVEEHPPSVTITAYLPVMAGVNVWLVFPEIGRLLLLQSIH